MLFYPFFISDYRNSTGHLNDEEDLAYRRLLDIYYQDESPLTLDVEMLARKVKSTTPTVQTLLKEFFVETENGWIHERCDAEILHYKKISKKNQENGKKGGRRGKTQLKSDAKPSLTESKPTAKRTLSERKATANRTLTDSEANAYRLVSEREPNAKRPPSNIDLDLDLDLDLRKESNTPLPPCEGDGVPDQSAEEQNKAPSQENGKRVFNAHALVEMWNVAIEDGANFPRVNESTFLPGTKRYRAAEARAREVPDGDYWVDTLIRIMNSDFCNGKNDRKWRADFDFFVRPDTHIKINEGKYDDK